MAAPRILVYLLRRDLRVADNPVLHELARLAKQSQKPFTHLLPLYIITVQQVEVSGFLASPDSRSPYPEARSQVGGFWRCGHHRVRFLAETLWDVKTQLESIGSGMEIRVGRFSEVLNSLIEGVGSRGGKLVGVWMTSEEGVEEKREEREVRRLTNEEKLDFKLFVDEKYFVDE